MGIGFVKGDKSAGSLKERVPFSGPKGLALRFAPALPELPNGDFC